MYNNCGLNVRKAETLENCKRTKLLLYFRWSSPTVVYSEIPVVNTMNVKKNSLLSLQCVLLSVSHNAAGYLYVAVLIDEQVLRFQVSINEV